MKILLLIISLLLLVACEDPRMKSKSFTMEESDKILSTLNSLDKENKKCVDELTLKYVNRVFEHCVEDGYAENIGGGCYHIVGQAETFTVSASIMESCGINWRI